MTSINKVIHSLVLRDSEMQAQMRTLFEAQMRKRLEKKPELIDKSMSLIHSST